MKNDNNKPAKKTFTPYRGGKAKPLSTHVERLTKRAFGKRGFADGSIISDWSIIVTGHLAELSAPERIVYPQGKKTGGTLYLCIASGSIALELQHLTPVLIEKINAHFGYRAVDAIRLKQAPVAKIEALIKKRPKRPLSAGDTETIAETLKTVDDPDIQGALERLGQAMHSRIKTEPK